MKKILILAILISGLAKAQTFDFYCPTESEIQLLESYYELGGGDSAPSELNNMIVKFKSDGNLNGHKVVFTTSSDSLYHSGSWWPGFRGWSQGSALGEALIYSNQRTKWVRFYADWWKAASRTAPHKIQAVYHELGHSYFRYSHSSTGIMRPGINQTNAEYTTNGLLNIAFLRAVSDLFNGVGQNGGKSTHEGVIICNFTEN